MIGCGHWGRLLGIEKSSGLSASALDLDTASKRLRGRSVVESLAKDLKPNFPAWAASPAGSVMEDQRPIRLPSWLSIAHNSATKFPIYKLIPKVQVLQQEVTSSRAQVDLADEMHRPSRPSPASRGAHN